MLSPKEECPILAKIGYAAIGWNTLTADRMLSPKGEYPILAKNGYAAMGWSTLSADRMLSPKEEYPILAKNGHTAIEYSTLSAVRVLYTTWQASCRPTRCLLRLFGVFVRTQRRIYCERRFICFGAALLPLVEAAPACLPPLPLGPFCAPLFRKFCQELSFITVSINN